MGHPTVQISDSNASWKNFKIWKHVSVTDSLPTKRIEKLDISEKKNCLTTLLFRVVQFVQSVCLVGRQLRTHCEILFNHSRTALVDFVRLLLCVRSHLNLKT